MIQFPDRDHLTDAERAVLRQLRDSEYPDNEIVCDGIECWVGQRRTSMKLVHSLLGMTAISDVSDEGGGARRYTINETGQYILADESNIQAVVTALCVGGAWTWKDGKLVKMNNPTDRGATAK